jgi:hypothetical protein
MVSETSLSTGLSSEVSRAIVSETSLSTGLASEVSRAIVSETSLSTGLSSEVSRAMVSETSLSTGLASEVSRAMVSETSLSTKLSSEVSRATSVEIRLSTGLDFKASLSTNNAFTGTNTFDSGAVINLLNAKRITEQIVTATVTGTATAGPFTLDYSTGSVFYLSTAPTSNFNCNIINIPSSQTFNQYTVTLLYKSSLTTVVYCSVVSASETSTFGGITLTSPTLRWTGGSVPAPTVTVNTIYAQSLTLLQCFTGNKYIIGNLATFG